VVLDAVMGYCLFLYLVNGEPPQVCTSLVTVGESVLILQLRNQSN
jgi:hypothetical protein